jgi:hypothetical protein
MNIEKARVWSEALRSGKYHQARNAIRNSKGDLCCLGVAYKCFISGADPLENPKPYSDLRKIMDLSEEEQDVFVELNDDRMKSFAEIADHIDRLIAQQATSGAVIK